MGRKYDLLHQCIPRAVVVFPPLTWLRTYNWAKFADDVVAGVVVLIMVVPQAVAYAQLAGLAPVHGLYACLVPPIVYALFGNSRELSIGPVAMVSMLTGSAVRKTGAVEGSEDALQYAVTLSFLSSLIGFGIAFARLGKLTTYLNHCVVSGFTAGAAVTIALSQMGSVLNVSPDSATTGYDTVIHLARAVQATSDIHSLYTFLMSCAALAFLIGPKMQKYVKIPHWFPLHFILVVFTTTLCYLCRLDVDLNLKIVKSMPSGLPSPSVPRFDNVSSLLVNAIMITIIGYMEAYSISMRFATRAGYILFPNQELSALSACNCVGSFFSSYPTTGSFSRTALNADLGAKSQLAGLIPPLGMIVVLACLNQYNVFYYLPKFVLSSIVIAAVIKLVDYHDCMHYWRLDKIDFVVWMVAFIGTTVLGVDIGLGVAILVSLVAVAYRTTKATFRSQLVTPNVFLFKYNGALYFTNVEIFATSLCQKVVEAQALAKLSDSDGKGIEYLVLDMSGVTDMDAVASVQFGKVIQAVITTTNTDIMLLLTHVPDECFGRLHATGFVEKWGAYIFCETNERAFNLIENQELLLERKAAALSSPSMRSVMSKGEREADDLFAVEPLEDNDTYNASSGFHVFSTNHRPPGPLTDQIVS